MLTPYVSVGQSMGELARTRYQSIGKEKEREGLRMQFAFEAQQRAALFDVLSQALLLGTSIAENYSKNSELNKALAKDKDLVKTSSFWRDLFGTPEYSKRLGKPSKISVISRNRLPTKENLSEKFDEIPTESLYYRMLRQQYNDAEKGW